MTLGLIWAEAANRVIGADGRIPWRLAEDQARFKRVTWGATVIMGRATWNSFPARFRPLPGRRNIVLSRDPEAQFPGAEGAGSIAGALTLAGDADIWGIGGAAVYAEMLLDADRLEVTQIDLEVMGETRAPALGTDFDVVALEPPTGWLTSATGIRYRFISYRRR